MSGAVLPLLKVDDLEQICRVFAEAVSHADITNYLKEARIAENGGNPRWERMLLALAERQSHDQCSNAVIAFACQILRPSRYLDRRQEYEELRRKVNFTLAFYGLQVTEQGKAASVSTAKTVSEAETRASELRSELMRRSVHGEVLAFCKAELLDKNYFHAVLEASKSLADKIRHRTALTADGAALVDLAFSTKSPMLAVNSLRTDTERSEQTGFANFLKGIFGLFRNVTAHAPKVAWIVDKREAMDALTIISYAHRRLDEATLVPKSR